MRSAVHQSRLPAHRRSSPTPSRILSSSSSSRGRGNMSLRISGLLQGLADAPFPLAILLTVGLLIAGYYQTLLQQHDGYSGDAAYYSSSNDYMLHYTEEQLTARAGLSITLIQPATTQQSSSPSSSNSIIDNIITAADTKYLFRHCPAAKTRYQQLVQTSRQPQPQSVVAVVLQLQQELIKYCAIQTVLTKQTEGSATAKLKDQRRPVAVYMDTTTDAQQFLVDAHDMIELLLFPTTTTMSHHDEDSKDKAARLRLSSASFAVEADARHHPKAIHAGSLLVLQQAQAYIAQDMLEFLMKSPLPLLLDNPSIVGAKLHERLSTAVITDHRDDNADVVLLQQSCHFDMNATLAASSRTCPESYPYCCSVLEPYSGQVFLLQKHSVVPYKPLQQFQTKDMRQPYNSAALAKSISAATTLTGDDMAMISTIREQVLTKSKEQSAQSRPPKSLYDILLETKRLPDASCLQCMHLKKCPIDDMYQKCSKYFGTLCSTPVPVKFVSKQLTVSLPHTKRDPTRLIPRIVHQTWYEALSPEDYPNMSRLQESFRQSGWEYRFYTDEDAVVFLQAHFPPEVLQAYNALLPGAFKADLFRYCALLISGGVYSDVDILLESNLDFAIAPDIGFMVPMDQPDACVWQGFIAAAPGHSFLAQAIETVVNQVRNRYTSIDLDASFCEAAPVLGDNINWKCLHMFDVLFTAGPCLLGASMNRVLGRHGQALWEPGDVSAVDGSSDDHYVPGRTVILKQNKWDMTGHRFTLVGENLIVAATDLENSDDRANAKMAAEAQEGDEDASEESEEAEESDVDDKAEKAESEETGMIDGTAAAAVKKVTSPTKEGGEHYSKAHAKTGIYGLTGLYVDQVRANDEIRILVDTAQQSIADQSFRKSSKTANSQAKEGLVTAEA